MIAITFALPTESAGLTAQLHREKIDSQQVMIVHTGVGQRRCEEKIDQTLKAVRPDLLISSGFAGGAREDLRVGDLILAENFSDQALVSSARQILNNQIVHVGSLFTSKSIVASVAERNEIARASGAAAVDMETEFIAQACAARGIRMLSLRVISDSVAEALPAPPQILFDLERQKTDFVDLATYLIGHPPATLRLLRFARQIKRARETLTSALVSLLKSDLC